MGKLKMCALGLFLGAGFLSSGFLGSAQAGDDFKWDGRLSPGQTLEVRGIESDIRANPARGGTATVEATSRRWGDLEVRYSESRDGVVICVAHVDSPRRGDPCDSDMSIEANDVAPIDFDVRVPDGVNFVGATVSGSVEAMDLDGDVEGATVDGDVVIVTSGRAEANTVSGDIDVTFGELGRDDLSFNTVSGDITLRMPDWVDADIEFESLSGDLSSEFELNGVRDDDDRMIGTEVEGTIGRGGIRIKMNTVSGDANLRRSAR